jgi:hypothetical protein
VQARTVEDRTLDRLLATSTDGRTLNDVAYALMGAGHYDRALPFARKAIDHTEPGSVTRGYATYNVGLSLLEVGRCNESIWWLKRALAIEAKDQRPYITATIKQAQDCAPGEASAPTP